MLVSTNALIAPSFGAGCNELLPIGSKCPARGLRVIVRFLVDLAFLGNELAADVLDLVF